MPEHQNIKQSRGTQSSQRQITPAKQVHASSPAAIIQRARIDPKSLTSADVLQLQHTIGNWAVGRLLSEIRSPSTVQHVPIQRQEIPEEEETCPSCVQKQEIPEEEPLQTNRENNTGMPDNLKAGVESLSGIDMSDVKVHYNSEKPAEVGALAYTQGTDIHVAPGQERHLPHETWHVVQQAQGRVRPTMQLKDVAVNDDVGLEREADKMGEMAILMRSPLKMKSCSFSPRSTNIPVQMTKCEICKSELTESNYGSVDLCCFCLAAAMSVVQPEATTTAPQAALAVPKRGREEENPVTFESEVALDPFSLKPSPPAKKRQTVSFTTTPMEAVAIPAPQTAPIGVPPTYSQTPQVTPTTKGENKIPCQIVPPPPKSETAELIERYFNIIGDKRITKLNRDLCERIFRSVIEDKYQPITVAIARAVEIKQTDVIKIKTLVSFTGKNAGKFKSEIEELLSKIINNLLGEEPELIEGGWHAERTIIYDGIKRGYLVFELCTSSNVCKEADCKGLLLSKGMKHVIYPETYERGPGKNKDMTTTHREFRIYNEQDMETWYYHVFIKGKLKGTVTLDKIKGDLKAEFKDYPTLIIDRAAQNIWSAL